MGKYRDAAIIGFSLLVALSGGIYLAGAVPVFGDPLEEAVVRTALGWCLAYYGCGFLVGFLFGIPRVLQGDNPPASGANTAAEVSGKPQSPGGAAAVGPAGYAQRVNTNLEQISDWLTKIIVGLGLVELRTMPDHLYRASDWMARSFATAEAGTPPQAAASFSSAFIVFFAIAGFMAGYLITRLFLAGAFSRADQQQPQTSRLRTLRTGAARMTSPRSGMTSPPRSRISGNRAAWSIRPTRNSSTSGSPGMGSPKAWFPS